MLVSRRMFPLLALALLPAVAHADEKVRKPFIRVEEQAGGLRQLLLEGEAYLLQPDVYRTHRKLLDELKPGDLIECTIRGRVVIGLQRAAAATAGEGEPVRRAGALNATFQSIEQLPNGEFFLRINGSGGPTYQMSEEVYAQCAAELHGLRPGAPIHVTTRGSYVLGLKRGHDEAASSVDPRIAAEIERSIRSDIVRIGDEEFRYLFAEGDVIWVQQRLPGTPDGWGDKISLRKDALASFVNPTARARGGDPGGVIDTFRQEDVRVGDTIGIGFDNGQLVELDETHYRLRPWRNDTWGEAELRPRDGVQTIRREWLKSQWAVPIDGGQLHVKLSRRRYAGRTGLEVEVELWHDSPRVLLVGLELQAHLGGLDVYARETPVEVERIAVPVLFPEQHRTLHHEVANDSHLDVKLVTPVRPQDVVALDSAGARPHILTALASEKDPQLRARTIAAAGQNGHPDLVRYLIGAAVAAEEQDPDRPLFLAGLAAAGPRLAEVVFADVEAEDRLLEQVTLRGEELVRERFDSLPRAIVHKGRMLVLLARVPGALTPESATRLFELSSGRDDLQDAARDAFALRADAAVRALLPAATAVLGRRTEDEQRRAERALQLLQSLGAVVLDDLLAELERREIDVRELRELRQQVGDRRADQVVGRAVAAAISKLSTVRLRTFDQRVDEAESALGEGDVAGALEVLRGVLAEEPTHDMALEILPDVLVTRARELRQAQERGEAALLLEEAVPLLPAPKAALAQAPLAELLLEAAREAMEGIPLRDVRHPAGKQLRAAGPGEGFQGERDGDWVRLSLPDGKFAFLMTDQLVPQGPDRYNVNGSVTPFAAVAAVIERARGLAPTLEPQANELLGQLHAREAVAKYETGDFAGALHEFSRVRELAPSDPRLELEWKCWAKANTAPVAAVAAVAVFGIGFIVLQLFSKPKKVEFTGEFKHYGANRSRVERNIEVSDAPPPPPPEDAAGT